MTRCLAWKLLATLLLLLLAGTQMPGAWRGSLEHSLHVPFPVSSLAHFILFAGIAGLLVVRPLSWRVACVALAALGLALLTEGLQFIAIDRHPRWIDVLIDMAGALSAVSLIKIKALCFSPR